MLQQHCQLIFLPTSPHQIGVHANVTDKTVRITVHRIYVEL